ncbi:DUF5689 domain-containing protein [uncultured Chitinophaga sp.]|uniref:DUF5689 domain-containing protein n=1 Tax=uncultured Chitinophaga sp. TaxID=339340 RepID=UPI0025FC8017|nr:DUF5689 domain-containing protein [uncultured Chitinophaga sp.]
MKKLLLAVSAVLLVTAACRKTEYYKFSTDLAIDSRTITIAAPADTTKFIVYADGDWSVEPIDTASWLTLTAKSGSGKGQAVAQLTDNSVNLPRFVRLLVKAGGKTDTVRLQQRGLVPTLAIADVSAQTIANGGTFKTPVNTNVPMEQMVVSYTHRTEGQQNWVSDLRIEKGYLYFKADTNHTAAARTSVLKLTYKDALNVTISDTLAISQLPGIDYEGATARGFDYIKTTLAAGVVNESIYFEGVVVSDKGHPNITQNLNNTDKHTLSKTENAIAVYIQSADGTKGIYLKTKTPGDNIYNFNDRVKVWLKGTTVQRLSGPDRVIITGVETKHIMAKNAGTTPLLPREKYMSELTDNDLYTYVKLKDVEISIPSGSFTNINEGYAARMDCYPTSIRDIQGNSMYMLTNLDVPYRRDGKLVPQGSGTIAGIIVNEKMDRFGGNIGRYAIRHLSREDIALNADRNAGFSKVLVEWSRFRAEYNSAPTAEANPLTPETGTGRIYHSTRQPLDFTANGNYATTDYNGLLQEPLTVKGAVTNGGWGSKNWWPTPATTTGAYWSIETSTAGITTPISLQLEGNTDIGGPRNFIVEWSGDNNAPFQQVGTFTFEDVANFSNTLLTQLPGYKAVNFQFPQAASGLTNLYIRVRVANKNVGTTTSATGGTLGATTNSRLGHVSIKYNK